MKFHCAMTYCVAINAKEGNCWKQLSEGDCWIQLFKNVLSLMSHNVTLYINSMCLTSSVGQLSLYRVQSVNLVSTEFPQVSKEVRQKLVLTELPRLSKKRLPRLSKKSQYLPISPSNTISTESPVFIKLETTTEWLVWTELLLLPSA